MARGRLEPLNLDDRTWQQLVDQAKALIPTYAPEWTDHNPSDLGITLIELFAWMTEQLIYRLNCVPEKTYIHLLNLLDITRDPATPSSTLLTFLNTSGSAVKITKGDQFATKQTESDAGVVFEVDTDLTVQPINLVAALWLYPAKIQVMASDGTSSEENGLRYADYSRAIVGDADHPPSDKKISINANGKLTLALGFSGKSQPGVPLRIRISSSVNLNGNSKIAWSYSGAGDKTWPGVVLDQVTNETNNLTNDRILQVNLPDSWTSQKPAEWTNVQPKTGAQPINEELRWIGVEFANQGEAAIEINLGYILFETNSVRATNALSSEKHEELGISTGKPFQAFEFANRPLYKEPGRSDPYSHVKIRIKGPSKDGSEGLKDDEWTQRDDLPQGDGKHYRLNAVTGTVYFGNYRDEASTADGHGLIPEKGSTVLATYRYVAGGANGNVPAGTVRDVRRVSHPNARGLGVTNMIRATGGSDEEAIEETIRKAPLSLRSRDRAITAEDYEYLARKATTDLKTVRCLVPLVSSEAGNGQDVIDGQARMPGHVQVVVMHKPLSEDPLDELTIKEDQRLIDEVKRYLDDRRILGTKLNVKYPRYLPIQVVMTIKVWKRAQDDGLVAEEGGAYSTFKKEQLQVLAKFLHPTLGGPKGTGWDIGQSVSASEVLAIIQPPPNIGYVEALDLQLEEGIKKNRPQNLGTSKYWIQLADDEIISNGTTITNITVRLAEAEA